MSDSPLITAATITAIVSAVIGLLVAFGIRLTAEQQIAIMTVVAVIAPIIVAFVGHKTTTPLSDPKDELGRPLSGPHGELTVAQTRAALKK